MVPNHEAQLQAFEKLKEQVVYQLQQAYPGCKSDLRFWTGREVEFLQQDLQNRVNGRVSERWFYNYLKPEKTEKLPRIDMLDLLANYVGRDNWEKFVHDEMNPNSTSPSSSSSPAPKVQWKYLLGIGFTLVILVFFLFEELRSDSSPPQHQLTLKFPENLPTFIAQDTRIQLLTEGESPKNLALDSMNRISVEAQGKTRLVVSGPYIKTDTIIRTFTSQKSHEDLILEPDHYALLIHYISSIELKNWKEKEKQLNGIFVDHAQIYQVMAGNQMGMDLFNKKQFIRKLIFPGSNLKNVEVLDVVYEGDRISKLKFVSHE
ncbi:hypothetical protein KFE98_01265 [bacterium SCSIO 12741]|nr:hypothetical protein KFE98_01265 [bacterium SCSIO 12741]